MLTKKRIRSIMHFTVSLVLLVTNIRLSPTFGVTSLEEKKVTIDKSNNLVREPPSRFNPHTLKSSPQNIEYRMDILPFSGDKYTHQQYIVVPTLGLIAPIQFANKEDEKNFIEGRPVDINPYLQNGIMYYHGTAKPGNTGNSVFFGHSNFLKNDPGRYKTIFSNIMALDPIIDEVWYYTRSASGFDLQKYIVTESFETDPADVEVMLPKKGLKETTLIACTDGVNGRRIIKGERKDPHYWDINNNFYLNSKSLIRTKDQPVVEEKTKDETVDNYKKTWKKTVKENNLQHKNVINQSIRNMYTLYEILYKKATNTL